MVMRHSSKTLNNKNDKSPELWTSSWTVVYLYTADMLLYRCFFLNPKVAPGISWPAITTQQQRLVTEQDVFIKPSRGRVQMSLLIFSYRRCISDNKKVWRLWCSFKHIRRYILLWTDIVRYVKTIVMPKISVYFPGFHRPSLGVLREIVE